jgi:lipid-A-disaccharide synthase
VTGKGVLIVAGEVSGDIHAGNMLLELKKIRPDVEAFGVGGDRLIAAGLDTVAHTDELAHMGLVEVVRELPRIRRVMHRLVEETARRSGLGIPVVLYVSPQLWAWRRGRVRVVRRRAREVLCILPFEVDFYNEHGVPARYVGHPLVDEIARVGLLDSSITPVAGRLAILPGSRAMEVSQLLPVMVTALKRISRDVVDDAVVVEAPGMEDEIEAVLSACLVDSRLRRASGEERRAELASSSLAWTASGTATLECALLGVPMVVGYRLRPLSAAIARMLVRVPNASLVNLIAGRTVVPELLQEDWNPEDLAVTTADLMSGGVEVQRAGLADVCSRLGGPGASRHAAEAIAEYLG